MQLLGMFSEGFSFNRDKLSTSIKLGLCFGFQNNYKLKA